MTTRRALALFVMQKLAVLGVLWLDLELFLGPGADRFAVLLVGEQWTGRVFMFRTQDPECSYAGPNTNYHLIWLPQWDCTPTETARYALLAGVVLCGLAVVLARSRTDTSGISWAFVCAQTVATAGTIMECVVGNWTSAVIWFSWVPLLLAVALWRAPAVWRRRMLIAAMLVVAGSAAYVVVWPGLQPGVNSPHWRFWSRAVSGILGTYWFAQQLVVLPLLAAVVLLVARSTAGALVRRVTVPVGGVALAAACAALIAQGLSGAPRYVVIYWATFARIAGALALAALVAVCEGARPAVAPVASPATPGGAQ